MKKVKSDGWMTYIIWMLMIPYNLLLLFSPLAILYFIFEMRSVEAKFGGMVLGVIFLFLAGLTPRIGKD